MNNIEFSKKALEIANKYKTLYVMGCFGAPMNDKNKDRWINEQAYNQKPFRTEMILQADDDTFGFDCVNLIKAIIWGWDGNIEASYGGAKYESNGLSDISCDMMHDACLVHSFNWDNVEIGEFLWMRGHCGIYIGDGKCVECSPKWDNCVQVSYVANMRKNCGYKNRIWVDHSRLPYIDYVSKSIDGRIQTMYDVPAYAIPTIKKLCDLGVLQGLTPDRDRDGYPVNLDLTKDIIKILVINDRCRLYDNIKKSGV